ncbi:transposase [Prauserella halophila]|nr:transposase [Prauserella halophila]MCP2238225.1 transposase [Prauserella halophila]
MAAKRYSREMRERAVALVRECQSEYDSQWEAICSIAAKVNVSSETLRKWLRQAEVDAGQRPGVSSEESAELKRLHRENAELRRSNEILKAASAFFARELDPRPPRSQRSSRNTRTGSGSSRSVPC